jgi:hypothetical protein
VHCPSGLAYILNSPQEPVSRRGQQAEQGGLDVVLLVGSEAEVEPAAHHEDEEVSPAAEVQQEEAQEVVSAQVQTEELPVAADEASVVAVAASELFESYLPCLYVAYAAFWEIQIPTRKVRLAMSNAGTRREARGHCPNYLEYTCFQGPRFLLYSVMSFV